MGDQEPLWLAERDVAELITLPEAIDVLADAYGLQARGAATSMRRAHVREGEAILHAVGGVIAGQGLTGTKTWTYTPRGASPLLVMFSLETGALVGVIEAFVLGQMRTAATSGLGTRVMAREDAHTLALIGTGKQAFQQALAVAAVRAITHIRVFGRDPTRRAAMAEMLRDELNVQTQECSRVDEATEGADVVTTITRAAEPVLYGAQLGEGMHINAVGAIVPSRRELDETAVQRCSLVVVDSIEQARDDAGELRAAADANGLDWGSVRGLDSIVEEPIASLRSRSDVTLFKTLGIGVSDVALGGEILRRARAQDVGRALSQPATTHD
jgi:ornithine cyclodeaminase